MNLIAFRKLLHQYPEVAGTERETARKITMELSKLNPDQLITDIGGHGIIAVFDTGKSGKSVFFRADMDALPIQEVNEFDYKSKIKGVAHKCGHDGHSTILLGLAQKIRQEPLEKGKIILLFQPAEETGEGAKAVLKDEKFAPIRADYAFALHNIPGYPKGEIVYKKGAFNPAVISLIIRLEGRQAHAAEQENGLNPDLAMAQLLQKLKALHHNDLASPHFCNITTVHLTLGAKDYGTAAGYGELHFTIRCWTKAKLEAVKQQVLQITQDTCWQFGLTHKVKWLHYFAATANNTQAVNYIEKAATKLDFSRQEKRYPFKWGEDFGLFTEHFAGAMFGIGAGLDTPALHAADYDFPDDILPIGIAMFYEIAKTITNES